MRLGDNARPVAVRGCRFVKVDVLIIGAGAAGLMCAIAAGQRGRRVLVVDHANKVGKKILMSGGGRCNFTNMGATPANYLSANPHFAKSALARYTPWDFIALVEKHRIAVPREGTWPAVLRRLVEADRAHAAGRMRRGRRHSGGELWRAAGAQDTGGFQRAHRARRGACRVAGGRHRAACRFPAWAPAVSATNWHGSSAMPCCPRAPAWCR